MPISPPPIAASMSGSAIADDIPRLGIIRGEQAGGFDPVSLSNFVFMAFQWLRAHHPLRSVYPLASGL
jgi:hypothetical protein